MSAQNPCLGCGHDAGPDVPTPEHCGHCPPWKCDQCGDICSMQHPCACWISLEGMSLADLKAVFARADLGLETPK